MKKIMAVFSIALLLPLCACKSDALQGSHPHVVAATTENKELGVDSWGER